MYYYTIFCNILEIKRRKIFFYNYVRIFSLTFANSIDLNQNELQYGRSIFDIVHIL